MPSGRPKTRPIAMAATVSSIVEGRTSSTSRMTLRPLESDWPKSPVRILPRKLRYWTWTGWSRPSFSLSAASEAALAWSPRMTEAASPGTRRTSTKIAVSITNRVGMASNMRLTR
jgi:hypothetical protein